MGMVPTREQIARVWQACGVFRAADAGARFVAEMARYDAMLVEFADPEFGAALHDKKNRHAATEFARTYTLDHKRFEEELASVLAAQSSHEASVTDPDDPIVNDLMVETVLANALMRMVARDFERALLARGCDPVHVRLLSHYSKFILPWEVSGGGNHTFG